MSELKLNMMMSLDGFAAGPEQSEENPFGIGGMQLANGSSRSGSFARWVARRAER
jgi:hypothetical protein